jgi:glycogen(starch) synthase
VDLFIAAAQRVAGDRVRFLIAGECREGAAIQDGYSEAELRARIGADDRIRYAGYREDMPSVYHSSDVIAVPSRWQEPFGLVLIEAAAAGKPAVATRVGGIPEVVVDGKTGFLVEPEDVEGLADRVQFLVDNPVARIAIGRDASKHVAEKFTDAPVRRLEERYASLISLGS